MKTRISLFTLTLFVAAANVARADTITWTNTAGGEWNDPANWNPNQLPGPSDTATLNVSLSGSLTVPDGAVLAWTSGTVGSGATLTVASNAIVNWFNGEIDGSVMVAAGGVLSLVNNVYYNILGGTLTNNGTVNWQTGTLYGYNGAVIYNAGLWDAQADSSALTGGATSFVNAGTFRKSGGAGTTIMSWPFSTPGVIDQQTGLLNINWSGDNTLYENFTGPINLNNNATLTLSSNKVLNMQSGTISSGSSLSVVGGATLNWISGTVAAGAQLTVAPNAVANWSNGEIDGSVLVAAGGVLNLVNNVYYNILGGTLTNNGTVNWQTGTLYGYNGAVIYNAGLWDAQADSVTQTGGATSFVNAGIFRKSGGAGTTTMNWPFSTPGVIDQQTGLLNINWSGDNTLYENFTGPINLNNNATLTLSSNKVLNMQSGTISSGSSLSVVGGATLNWISGMVAAGAQLTVAPNALANWSNGEIDGSVLVAAGGVLNLVNNVYYNFSGGTLTNNGAVNWQTGTLYGYNGAVIYNAGLWDAQADSLALTGGATTFINAGTFRKSGGVGTTTMSWPFSTPGVIDQQTGLLNISWSGDNILRQNISGPVALNNGATLTLSNMTLNWISGTISSGSSLTAMGGATLNWNNGMVASGAQLTVASSAVANWANGEVDGSVLVAAGGVLNLVNNVYYYFAGGTLTNSGTVNWQTGTVYGYNGAVIYNAGLWDAQADSSALTGGATSFVNAGTFRKSGGAGTTFMAWPLANPGILSAQTGIINLAGSYDLTGGTLNFILSSHSAFGRIQLSGSPAILTGTIAASLNNGYTPVSGDTFGVVVYASATGTFNLAAAPSLALGADYGAPLFSLIISNVAPAFGVISNLTVNEGTAFTITNRATDPDIERRQIIGISIPTNSMDASCYPLNDGVWSVAVPPYPLTNSGIGHLIDPAPGGNFTLHDHVYANDYVPDPTRAVVTYEFTNAIVVKDIEVVQHANGITQIEGYVGDSPGSLISIGSVFGPVGDTTTPFAEGQLYPFHFTNDLAGKFFRFVIRKTVIANGYALYRAYPSLGSGNSLSSAMDPPNTLAYTLLTAPTNASISAAGVINWTPDEAQGPSTYTFTTAVTDDGTPILSATNTFTVVVNEVNTAPVLPTQTGVAINELTTLTVTNTATDSDLPANPLTYTLNGPAGATISTNGIITWSITESDGPSTNTFTTIVTDTNTVAVNATSLSATNTFTVIVNEINVAPVLTLPPGTNINELAAYAATATATDSDIPANTLTFALVSGPGGLTVSPGGNISWTPTEADGPSTNTVTISVTDSNPFAVNATSLSVTNSYQIIVAEVNIAPVLPAQTNLVINEGATLSVTNTATDSDLPTNVLTYSLLAAPGAATISTNGIITWVTTESDGPGTNTFTTKVVDNGSPNLSATNTFTVVANEINIAPVLTLPPNTNINELVAYAATATATDADIPANPLTFALVSGPSGLTVSPSGAIAWTPTEADGPSTNTVTISVTDTNQFAVNSKSLSVTNSYQIIVAEVNSAPVLPAQTNLVINEGATLSVTNTATDSDIPTNVLTCSLLAAPGAATISTNGVITWITTESDGPGTNTFTTKVVDNGSPNLSATNTFIVVVNEINVAPVLTLPPNTNLNELVAYAANATATDSDIPANPLTFALVSGPSGLTVSPSGNILWTPDETQGPGTYTVTIKVSDTNQFAINSTSLSATNSYQIIINEVNVAPVVGPLNNYTVNSGQSIGFTATATDADVPTNVLTFALVNPPSGAGINGGGAFTWRPTTAQASSTNTLRIKVTDNGTPNLSGTNSFTVVVNPLAATTLAPVGYANGQFTLQVSGTSGPDYIISASTNLTLWTDLFTNLSPATPFQYTDTNGSALPDHFYRVRLAP